MKVELDAYSTLEKPTQETENVSALEEEKPILPSLQNDTKPEISTSVDLEINITNKPSEREGNCYWFVHVFFQLIKSKIVQDKNIP